MRTLVLLVIITSFTKVFSIEPNIEKSCDIIQNKIESINGKHLSATDFIPLIVELSEKHGEDIGYKKNSYKNVNISVIGNNRYRYDQSFDLPGANEGNSFEFSLKQDHYCEIDALYYPDFPNRDVDHLPSSYFGLFRGDLVLFSEKFFSNISTMVEVIFEN